MLFETKMRVLRYCASPKSIPMSVKDKDINVLFGLDKNGQPSTYNPATRMSFGYSYYTKKEDDYNYKPTKFELDILNPSKEYQRQFNTSYRTFINRYNDEDFRGCQYDDPMGDYEDYSSDSSDDETSFVYRDYAYEEFLERNSTPEVPEEFQECEEEIQLENEMEGQDYYDD